MNLTEPQDLDETDETDATEEIKEIDELDPQLWERIDEAISKCQVQQDKDTNGPLFILAHEVRSMEEELKVRFSINLTEEVVRRWKEENPTHLDDDHDYLAEFLDKLSLVRFPRGRALLRAVEIARGLVPPKPTAHFCPDFQLLARLCHALQDRAGEKPFFLDGRSAAKALGIPHATVASWLRALHRLGIIQRVSRGNPGLAARYVYIAADLKRVRLDS